MDTATLSTRFISSLSDVSQASWNSLDGTDNPFLSHQFLFALEENKCVGDTTAWRPTHLIVEDGAGTLVAALPLYIKLDSWGEFVFDWAWADAYQRAGLPYYPKLVAAVPFTPATGPRFLISAKSDTAILIPLMINAVIELAQTENFSGAHFLFPRESQKDIAQSASLMIRMGVQFHWHNQDYRDFQDFLDSLTSKKRKQIRRERRSVAEQNIEIQVLSGSETSELDWRNYYKHYCNTFMERGHQGPMNLDFFIQLSEILPEQVCLTLCKREEEIVGAAFMLQGGGDLYGRHWGGYAEYNNLHFDACYYTGIEHAIENKLSRFEPGAQGEHKIPRGFLPTRTWSAHWIAHPQFRDAIQHYLKNETDAMEGYIEELSTHTPYRQADNA